jgi:endonuclease YncB( thermonuclease family)
MSSVPSSRWLCGAWLVLVVAGGLLPGKAGAESWSGRVVAVHDGDTLTVLRYWRGVKVRLNAIDAPELGQPYGRQSRKSLSSLCFGRSATVATVGQDPYGRLLARVTCGGLDTNAEQLRRGMAWHYVQYSHDATLQALEDGARSGRRGLWADGSAQPPWSFRHGAGVTPGQSGHTDPAAPRNAGGGAKRTCKEMTSCAEARHYLSDCGIRTLDANRNGIPCESLCKSAAK